MEKQIQRRCKIKWILQALLISYIITTVLLLILTFLLYKTQADKKLVSALIVAIYVIATLIGGIVIGKSVQVRRLLWGLVLGLIYFTCLLLITLGVYHTIHGNSVSVMTTFLLCAAGGAVGGMIS